MSHLVATTAFRAGKSTPWLESNALNPNDSLLTRGVTELLYEHFKDQRLFVIKTAARFETPSQLKLKLMYFPRIKMELVEESFSLDSQEFLMGTIDGLNGDYSGFPKEQKFKTWFIERSEDLNAGLALFSQPYNYVAPQINKWLNRKMRRGSAGAVLSTQLNPSNHSQKTSKRLRAKIKLRLRLQKKLPKRFRWKYDQIMYRQIDDIALSLHLSKVFHREISIETTNVWTYLAKKRMSKYWGHQEQLWHHAYRRFRYDYANYYDLVNAATIIGLVRGSEHVFLRLVEMIMPSLYDPKVIKRYLRFLDTLIKNVPLIKKQFRVFKMTFTGKLAGGTKRTKTKTIGFGKMSWNTIGLDARGLVGAYTQNYGEFGIKMIVCRKRSVGVGRATRLQTFLRSSKRWNKWIRKKWSKKRARQSFALQKNVAAKVARRLASSQMVNKKEYINHVLFEMPHNIPTWFTNRDAAYVTWKASNETRRIETIRRMQGRQPLTWHYKEPYPRHASPALRIAFDLARNRRDLPGIRYKLNLKWAYFRLPHLDTLTVVHPRRRFGKNYWTTSRWRRTQRRLHHRRAGRLKGVRGWQGSRNPINNKGLSHYTSQGLSIKHQPKQQGGIATSYRGRSSLRRARKAKSLKDHGRIKPHHADKKQKHYATRGRNGWKKISAEKWNKKHGERATFNRVSAKPNMRKKQKAVLNEPKNRK